METSTTPGVSKSCRPNTLLNIQFDNESATHQIRTVNFVKRINRVQYEIVKYQVMMSN